MDGNIGLHLWSSAEHILGSWNLGSSDSCADINEGMKTLGRESKDMTTGKSEGKREKLRSEGSKDNFSLLCMFLKILYTSEN